MGRRRSYRRISRRVRSQAAKKAWLTRTRNEGVRQLVNVAVSKMNVIDLAKTAKDITMGVLKILKPDVYRKHKLLKKIDKSL